MMRQHYQGLAHVAVFTDNLENSIAFYEKIGGTHTMDASISEAAGEKKLALMDFDGFIIELIQPPTPIQKDTGVIPHLAIYVDDLDKTVADLKAAGVDSFLTDTKDVAPERFGGCENWFFTGPSGEQIELLRML